jgi:Lipopolysaccharide export system permease LptF/LptG
MSRPGDRLRALARHLFDAGTMERLIDPVIADLQVEYAEAARDGRVWRRRWVRAVGCGALFYVAAGELRVFLGLLAAFTVLFDLPALLRWGFTAMRAVYLIPQGLVVAVPVAMVFAISWASGPASQSRKSSIVAAASAAVCSLVVFMTFAWWVPSANQAFRVSVTREAGWRSDPIPGLPEMTIGELRAQIKSPSSARTDWRELQFTYHSRWALPIASLSLAVLILALRRRGVNRRGLLAAAPAIVFGYYVLIFVGRYYALSGSVPYAAFGAWMPNLGTFLVASLIVMSGRRRQVAV